MKTIENILILLKNLFQEVENIFLSETTLHRDTRDTIGFIPFKSNLSGDWFIKEYFSHGLQFLIGIVDERIYFYLKAEYIGGYDKLTKNKFDKKFWNVPQVEGYIPIFCETIVKLNTDSFLSAMFFVFDYLQHKEENTHFQSNQWLKRYADDNRLKERIAPALDDMNRFFFTEENSTFNPYYRSVRNPFSMRLLRDGAWLSRSYSNLVLLFGEREVNTTDGNKLYVLARKKDVPYFKPIIGFTKEPLHLFLWTRIYVDSLGSLSNTELSNNLKLVFLNLSAQLYSVAKEREKVLLNSFS